MYRKVILVHSMTTSGVHRPPHKATPKHEGTTTLLHSLDTVSKTFSLTRLPPNKKPTIFWFNIWHSSVKRTWCELRGVHSACCCAHLYHAAWCRECKDGPRHGRRERSCASWSLLCTVWVVICCTVEARKAIFNMVALLSGFFQAEIRK